MKLSRKPLALAVSGFMAVGAANTLAQGMLEEVVVTAQKREQGMSDLGISVTAFSGDVMRDLGMEKPIDLAAQTPGLVIQNILGDAQPAMMIRGVGITDFNTNTNPGVGVYVDEVYKPIAAQMGFSLFDMQRVEVLKGPQGTLYGQNTTGGAVSFFTNRPTEEFEAYLSGTVGNYERTEFEGGISGPLTDSIRGRLSGIRTDQGEGFQDDLITGDDHGEIERTGVRAQLEVDFSDTVQGIFRYTYGRDKSDSQVSRVDSLELYQAYYYTFFDGAQSDIDHYDILLGEEESRLDNTSHQFGMTFNADLGFATLTSVTGYDELEHRNIHPFDGTELAVQNGDFGGDLESFTQEFRLTSNEGELVDWILGLYYSDISQDNFNKLDLTDGLGFLFYYYGLTDTVAFTDVNTKYDQTLETLAAFAHTEWHVGDNWKVTAGIRFARDELDYKVVSLSSSPPCTGELCDVIDLYYGLTDYDSAFATFLNFSDGGVADGPRENGIFATKKDSADEDSITWRLGLDWAPTDDVLVYGNVANGTKAQGFFGGLASNSPAYVPYDPEELMAYELGFKLGLLEGTMQLNGAVFFYDYEDQQMLVDFDPGIGLAQPVLTNIAESEITGAELELNWAPVDGLTMRFTGSWLDTELTDNAVSSPLPVFPGAEPVEGEDLAYAPEFTFSGLVRYDFSVGDTWGAFVQVDGNYADTQLSLPARRDLELDSQSIINARAGFLAQDGTWDISIWGKNLGDDEFSTYRYALIDGSMNAYVGPRRTYGLTLRYNFF